MTDGLGVSGEDSSQGRDAELDLGLSSRPQSHRLCGATTTEEAGYEASQGETNCAEKGK